MSKKGKVLRDGLNILGSLGSGLGDPILTRDPSSKDVTENPPIDPSSFLTTSLLSGRMIVGNISNVATAVQMSGMGNISNTGVFSIVADSITNTHINATAGILYSKLNLTGGIVNTDISSSAGIVRTKIASGNPYRVVTNDGSGVLFDAAAITPSMLLISNVNGIPIASSVTDLEASWLSGVISPIQAQFSNKLSFSSLITPVEGDTIIYVSGAWNRLGIGATNDVLTVIGGYPSWQAGSGSGLPSQTGNALKFLTTNGTSASWGSNFTFDTTNRRLIFGTGNTNAQGTDNFLIGTSSSIEIGSWNFVQGEDNHINRPSGTKGVGDNAILSGYLNYITTTSAHPYVGTFETVIVGGFDNKSVDGTQGVIVNGSHNLISERASFAGGEWAQASGYGAFAYGIQDDAGHPLTPAPTQRVLASGRSSFNFSVNNNSQTVGNGALAERSFILNTRNGHIPSDSAGSGLLGGDGMVARASDPNQIYVPNFNILTTPSNDNALTQILARDATTGQIKYRTAASLGGGGGGTWGSITGTLSSQTDLQSAIDLKSNLYLTHNTQTANYVLVLTDKDSKLVEMNVASANTVTVPPNGTVAFPIGTQIPIVQYGAGLTSLVAGVGVTINSSSGSLNSAGQFAPMFIEKRATNEWYLWNGASSSSGVQAITTVTTNTTLDTTYYTVLVDATSGNITITLPAAASITGRIYIIKKIDVSTNTVTVDGNASETIDGATTKVITTQYSGYAFQSGGTNIHIVGEFIKATTDIG